MTVWPQGPVVAPPGMPPSRKTPPELLAMAVLNFVFGGLGLAGAAWTVIVMSTGFNPFLVGRMQGRPPPAAFAHLIEMMTPTPTYVWVTGLPGLLASVLLIVSGFGYLRQKRVLGRGLAHAYVIASLVTVAAGLCLAGPGSMIGLMLIPGLTYPVITLVMLNRSLRKYFVS
jgi:hypothetical protein